MIKEILKATPISSVMTSPVISVLEEDDFSAVKEKFELYNIRHLPVVNDAGRLVGLITQRDLYKIHSPRKLMDDAGWYYDKDLLDGFILKNVMLKEVYTLKVENTLEDAIKAVVSFKFGCIPVVDPYNIPLGIVTRDNIFKFLLTK